MFLLTFFNRPPRRPIARAIAAAALWAALPPAQAADAQLPLRDALRQADRGAFGTRIAAGAAAEQQAHVTGSLRGILPSVHAEGGFVRTTDPIGAFGDRLRQRTLTAADFDPARLNYPGPVGNYQAGLVAEQPLVAADAWLGNRAARTARDASDARLTWSRLAVRADVIRAYYGAVLAAEATATLEHASVAAHAHQRQAESMVSNGLVTKSDALLAAVRAGDLDAQLIAANGDAGMAIRQLEVAMGRDPDGTVSLPRTLPSSDRIRALAAPDTADRPADTRADVDAARLGLDAARADLARARATYLPRINGFARYDWNSPSQLYGGEKNWTVGVMASWSPFAGGSQIADIQGAQARASSAGAQADAAAAKSRLDVEQSRSALVVALARLDIAERAVAQSTEAHRIVGRKYEGGLATIAELLDAQAVETQSAVSLSRARYAVIVADAERHLALGMDPGAVAALDDTPSAPAGGPASTARPLDQ